MVYQRHVHSYKKKKKRLVVNDRRHFYIKLNADNRFESYGLCLFLSARILKVQCAQQEAVFLSYL